MVLTSEPHKAGPSTTEGRTSSGRFAATSSIEEEVKH